MERKPRGKWEVLQRTLKKREAPEFSEKEKNNRKKPKKNLRTDKQTDKRTEKTTAKAEEKSTPRETSLLEDLSLLLLKIILVAACFGILFVFIFGIYRNTDVSMSPALNDGDVVFYYRINKDYEASDLVVYEYNDTTMTGRVVAVQGDTVEINAAGLIINGSPQQENNIFYETLPYVDGTVYPVTVGAGQVFVLGDNRERASDSRAFGCIDISATKGEVIAVFRRRNF